MTKPRGRHDSLSHPDALPPLSHACSPPSLFSPRARRHCRHGRCLPPPLDTAPSSTNEPRRSATLPPRPRNRAAMPRVTAAIAVSSADIRGCRHRLRRRRPVSSQASTTGETPVSSRSGHTLHPSPSRAIAPPSAGRRRRLGAGRAGPLPQPTWSAWPANMASVPAGYWP
jgi:hypothetical protein